METSATNRVWPTPLTAVKIKLLLLQRTGLFQDRHLVKVLCDVLGERLRNNDVAATNHGTEQPSTNSPRVLPVNSCFDP